MSSPLAPLDSSTLPEELDYAGMLRESLERIKTLAGEQWSNLNASDPGYTILEQLAYALTELGYRAGLPVPTLLADGDSGGLDLRLHGLYSPPEIFPSAPLNITDQRRILLDQCAEISNVWFEMLPSQPMAVSSQDLSAKVAGLYRLVVLPADANQWFLSPEQSQKSAEEQIRNRVHDSFTSLRNLCEDIASIRVLQPRRFEIRSLRLLLEPEADPDLMLATVLYQLGLHLNPEPRRQSLQQRRSSDQDEESPLAGPLPRRGFIADEQLCDRPRNLDTVRMRQLLCAIDGVIELEDLDFCFDATSGHLRQKTVLAIPQDCYVRLGLDCKRPLDTIELVKNAGKVTYNPSRMVRLLSNLWREHRQVYDTVAEAEVMFALPSASGGDLASYTSLLRQFPAAYQLDVSDSDEAVGYEEIAKRRQLKAYLMLFDQFMADALGQLASMRRLFSLSTGEGPTWQARSLRSIPGCDASLLVKGYEEKHESLRQCFDGGLQRQSAILEFLLSLSGQSLSLGQASGWYIPGLDVASPAVVAAQHRLLSDLMELSRDRGLGINYRAPIYREPRDRDAFICDLTTPDQLTALERRCSLQVSATVQLQDAANPIPVLDADAASFGKRLSGFRNGDVRACLQPIRTASMGLEQGQQAGDSETDLSGRQVYAPLLENLGNKHNYRIAVSALGNGYDLFCFDTHQDLWLLFTFTDDVAACRCACRLAEEALWRHHRGMASVFLVEWTLLRSAMDQPTTSGMHPDEFGHRVTAVLPQDLGNPEAASALPIQQEALQQSLQSLLPAHVQLNVVRLDPGSYAQFLETRRSWLLALADGQPDAMAAQSLRMLRLISPQSCPEPIATTPSTPVASSTGMGHVLLTWPQNTQALGLMLTQANANADLGLLLLLADSPTNAKAVDPIPPAAAPPPPNANNAPIPKAEPADQASSPSQPSLPQPSLPLPGAASDSGLAPPAVSNGPGSTQGTNDPVEGSHQPVPVASEPSQPPAGLASNPSPVGPMADLSSQAMTQPPVGTLQGGPPPVRTAPTVDFPVAPQPAGPPQQDSADVVVPPPASQGQPFYAPQLAWNPRMEVLWNGVPVQWAPPPWLFAPGGAWQASPDTPAVQSAASQSAAGMPSGVPPVAPIPPLSPASGQSTPAMPGAPWPVMPVADAPPPSSPAASNAQPATPETIANSAEAMPQGGVNPASATGPEASPQASAAPFAVPPGQSQAAPVLPSGQVHAPSTPATQPEGAEPPPASPDEGMSMASAPMTGASQAMVVASESPALMSSLYGIRPARNQALGLGGLQQSGQSDLIDFCKANQVEFLILPLQSAPLQILPSREDLERILKAGLAVMMQCQISDGRLTLDEASGLKDALKVIANAKELGLPLGLTIWLDASKTDGVGVLSAYVSGWARAIVSSGYDTGLFVSGEVSTGDMQVNRFCRVTAQSYEPMLGFSMQYLPATLPGLDAYSGTARLYQILSDRRSTTPSWLSPAP